MINSSMDTLTLSLPLATIVDTVPVPLAPKVDRTPSVPLAMIVAVFTNVRGIACFQIFTPRNPALGARKSAAKELKTAQQRTIIQQYGDWYTGR